MRHGQKHRNERMNFFANPFQHRTPTVRKLGVVLLLLPVVCMADSQPAWTRENPFRVEAVAANFKWSFRYAGKDVAMCTVDRVSTSGALFLPADSFVEITLHSSDFIYVFSIPRLRQKEMAVPDLTFKLVFQTGASGAFEFVCDDVCGLPRANLTGKVTIETMSDLQKNLQELGK